jgi:hypothetical protein
MATEIDRFLEGYAPEIRDLTHRVRALVASVAPDADETLKVGWKVIWYGFGSKMPDQFAVVMPTKNHVGLGFAHGSELPDPDGRLEGEGKRIRHVKLRRKADVEDPAIATLLRLEVALTRGAAKRAKAPAARAKRKGPAAAKATKGRARRTAQRVRRSKAGRAQRT